MTCKFCGFANIEFIVSYPDIDYFYCCGCSSIFSTYMKFDIKDYYTTYYHTTHQQNIGHEVITDRFEHDCHIAKLRLLEVMSMGYVPNEHNKLNLMDVGCSNGALVKVAIDYGYDAYGVEVDQGVVDIANDLINYDRVRKSTAEEIDRNFDIIILNDVLEHLIDPANALAHLTTITNYLLVIESPNPLEYNPSMSTNWKHFRYKEHLNILSPSVIEKYCKPLKKSKLIYPIQHRFALYMERNLHGS